MHHVGPACGEVPRNEGVDAIVPEHEVSDDAVRFLAARQEIRIVASDLDGFGSSFLGDKGGCQPHRRAGDEEQRDSGKT